MSEELLDRNVAGILAVYCLVPPPGLSASPAQGLSTFPVNILEEWNDPVPEILTSALKEAKEQIPGFSGKFQGWRVCSITVIQISGPYRKNQTNLLTQGGLDIIVTAPEKT